MHPSPTRPVSPRPARFRRTLRSAWGRGLLWGLALLWGLLFYLDAHGRTEETAKKLFLRLPLTIFDNTGVPLSALEKDFLLETGKGFHWRIAAETTDLFALESVGVPEASVTVRFWHGNRGGVAALGAATADSCAVELWHVLPDGGMVPLDPPEPNASLAPGAVLRTLPEGQTDYLVCLAPGADALVGRLLFWDREGRFRHVPEGDVRYEWNGSAFVPVRKGLPRAGK